jgi:hypothetical protein
VPTYSDSTFSRYTGRWLIITAVFELLLAGGFFVGANAAPGAARGGLLLTAVILGVVGVGLLLFGIRSRRKAKDVGRVEQTGLPGQATIVGMTQTGMYLNENPQIDLQMQVTVPSKGTYEAHHKSFIPLMLLGRLQQGATFPVKVDPQDPQNIVIDWTGSAPAQPAWGGGQWAGAGMAGAQGMQGGGWPGGQPGWTGGSVPMPVPGSLAPQFAGGAMSAGQVPVGQVTAEQVLGGPGVEGTGTIAAVQDTGATVGDVKVMSLTMDVTVPGRPSTRITHVAMVPVAVAGKLAAGKTVPLRTSLENPQLVHVDWRSV